MTDEQIAKRRKIERTSQRNSRAKTKARVQDLERVIESLRASEGDERLESTMKLLIQKQEQGRKLQGFLKDLHRLLNDNEHLWCDETPPQAEKKGDLVDSGLSDGLCGVPVAVSQQSSPSGTILDLESPLDSNIARCIRDNAAGFASSSRDVPVWKSVDIALERAVQFVGQTAQSFQQRKDMDIAIRAITDGWTNVKAMHVLDVDWLTLKEIDQTLFCDCSPPTRLAILYALRLNMFVSRSRKSSYILLTGRRN
jgi:hypothetical protein